MAAHWRGHYQTSPEYRKMKIDLSDHLTTENAIRLAVHQDCSPRVQDIVRNSRTPGIEVLNDLENRRIIGERNVDELEKALSDIALIQAATYVKQYKETVPAEPVRQRRGSESSLASERTNPPIAFKRVDSHDWIYDDRSTGAHKDFSIWRPTTAEYGYYAVGDVAVASHSRPDISSVMVKALTDDALKAPDSFTEIWNDRGSRGRYDVRIMKMNPPSGYVCLGHVAVLGYGSNPDKNKYRCIRSEYVISGRYDLVWLDRGSGARRDVGVWGNGVSESNREAVDANTFTSFSNHATPGGAPNMLSGQYAINHQNLGLNSDYIITIYEVTDMDEIWNDRGSGAYKDVAVWRSRGTTDTYSLGDIAVEGGKPSKGYVVKAHRDDALREPYDFSKVWDDKGSGAKWDGAFWKPLCPPGYRSLGHVATRNHGNKPPTNAVACVKAEYTISGQWTNVWTDAGSGADADVSVWKAVRNGKGQGVEAMSSVRRHGNMDTGAYVLNPEQVNYVIGKPVKRYIMQNIQYLYDESSVLNIEPETIRKTVIENHGTTEQITTREVGYEYTEEYSWSNIAGLEIGVETTVSAGVPMIRQSEITVSTTASYSHEWGRSTSKTFTDQVNVEITVQPNSQKAAVIVGNRYKTDVPYTANLIIEYEDGSRAVRNQVKGVFRGVQINDTRVIYQADVPLI